MTLILDLILILIPTTVMHANEEMDENTTQRYLHTIKSNDSVSYFSKNTYYHGIINVNIKRTERVTFNRFDFLRLVRKE